ncbi:MAG: RNA polymerase sigma factor [Planctomycetales bacterium]|nr:RNA polymerase sigma factor [Planctomycetales bacterium]
MGAQVERVPKAEEAVQEPDAALVEKSRAGDQSAFGTLVERHQRWVVGFLAHMTGDWQHGEDLAQEAFLRAFGGLARLRDPARFRSWVGGIAAHVALDWRRRTAGTRRERPLDEAREPAFEPGSPDSLAGPPGAGLAETLAAVRAAALSLPEEERTVLALRAEGGLSYADIGSALGIEESQVKGRLHRARRSLRERLGRWRRRGGPLPGSVEDV